VPHFSNFPIERLTSFQHKGVVKSIYFCDSVDELRAVWKAHSNICVLGKGSNSIIDPEKDDVVYIKLNTAIRPAIVHGTTLQVSAATQVYELMKLLVKHQLSGLEFAAGVPAAVGGMVAMNFGCWGEEVKDVISRVQVMKDDLSLSWIDVSELALTYRSSILHSNNWIVIAVEFTLKTDTISAIQKRIKDNIKLRLQKQPLRGKTFGSTFKNPGNASAGALIEHAGLKGLTKFGVKVSELHANFLENLGEASYTDVVEMIQFIQKTVQAHSGILLEPEVCLL
jgi:UDP-N-acetylmuramate dehydrogenase